MKIPADCVRVVSEARARLIARVSKLDWLTTMEAALYCRFGRSAFEKMVVEIPIPFSRPAGPRGERRFFRPDLDAALLSRRENAAPAA